MESQEFAVRRHERTANTASSKVARTTKATPPISMIQIPRTTNEPIAPTAIHITTGRRNSRPPIQTVATITGIAPAINLAGTPS